MNIKNLLREVCNECKRNGVKVTRGQAKAVLEALKEVSIRTCKKGDKVQLRGFLTVEGINTKATRLPDGKITEPRLKIKVKLSESLQEQFKRDILDK